MYDEGIMISCSMGRLNDERTSYMAFYPKGQIHYIVNYYSTDESSDFLYDGDYIMYNKRGKVLEHEFYSKGQLIFRKTQRRSKSIVQ
jgi:hypothetical protein